MKKKIISSLKSLQQDMAMLSVHVLNLKDGNYCYPSSEYKKNNNPSELYMSDCILDWVAIAGGTARKAASLMSKKTCDRCECTADTFKTIKFEDKPRNLCPNCWNSFQNNIVTLTGRKIKSWKKTGDK